MNFWKNYIVCAISITCSYPGFTKSNCVDEWQLLGWTLMSLWCHHYSPEDVDMVLQEEPGLEHTGQLEIHFVFWWSSNSTVLNAVQECCGRTVWNTSVQNVWHTGFRWSRFPAEALQTAASGVVKHRAFWSFGNSVVTPFKGQRLWCHRKTFVTS